VTGLLFHLDGNFHILDARNGKLLRTVKLNAILTQRRQRHDILLGIGSEESFERFANGCSG
jgi:hypothetical protein